MQGGQGTAINLDGSGLRIAIARARFNGEITERLKEGALRALKIVNVPQDAIFEETIPGSAELPFLLDAFAQTKKFDALIGLSCVIKGETDHYYHVAKLATSGILKVSLMYHIPIGFGVLAVASKEQALERAKDDESNLGFQAAMAVIECALKKKHVLSL